MKQFTVHAADETCQGFRPAYTVLVHGASAVAQAFSENWEQTARSVQDRLNLMGSMRPLESTAPQRP